MAKIFRTINKLPVLLLKVLFILPFFAFGAWLLQIAYFPKLELKEPIVVAKPAENEDAFMKILKQTEPVPRGHFHTVDEYVLRSEPNPPLCLTCHGSYPHSKNEKVRSLLNLHTGYIACAVCHAPKDSVKDTIYFNWVDRQTGEMTTQVQGEYGKYSAKIFPIKIAPDGQKSIFRPVHPEAAQQYLKLRDAYTPDQISQAKKKLHENISTKPVSCADCHKQDGYLDFAGLGFSQQRVDHLNSSEVVGLIEKYKTFYIPAEIDFGAEKPR